MQDIAQRFAKAAEMREDLIGSIPITANGGAQILDGSLSGKDTKWTEADVWAFAKDLETLDIDANALYYKLKPAAI